jgi:hypothetical protein
MTSVETFAWLPGGFFMIHQWDTRQGAVEIKGMEIMGYDGRSKVYTSRFFDNFGNSGSAKATLHGNTWIWAGDSEIGAKPVRERCTVTITSPDSYTNTCEYSTDGAKWQTTFVLRSTRAK